MFFKNTLKDYTDKSIIKFLKRISKQNWFHGKRLYYVSENNITVTLFFYSSNNDGVSVQIYEKGNDVLKYYKKFSKSENPRFFKKICSLKEKINKKNLLTKDE